MDEFNRACHDLAVGIDVVIRARDNPLIRQFLKGFKAAESLKLDATALREEIRGILASIRWAPFALEGKSGLDEANEARFAIRAGRDRVIAINGALRDVLFDLTKRYRLGKIWLRKNEPEITSLTLKEAEDVVAIVLSDVHDRLEEVKNLLVETKEAVDEFNDKARVIDVWMNLHKEYAFHNGNRRYDHDDEKAPQPPSRKLGASRR